MPGRKAFTVAAAVSVILLLTLLVVRPAWGATYKVLYKFRGDKDWQYPATELIFDAAGNLYGTTSRVSSDSYSTVFKLTPNPDGTWAESVLTTFAHGISPSGRLVFDGAGNLYDTTEYGGKNDAGTVFMLTPMPHGKWIRKVLHSFDGADGAGPFGGLVFDADGNLYGTTALGSNVAYQLAPNPDGTWTENIIHTFAGPPDGVSPYDRLTFDAVGNLYGTTYAGGTGYCFGSGCGTVFEVIPNPNGSWSENVIYSFQGQGDGRDPWAGVAFDAAGNLYGTTQTPRGGTVFELLPNPDGSWTKITLHHFKGPDGAQPVAGVVIDSAGNLYGTTFQGGHNRSGTVYEIKHQPNGIWEFTSLRQFKKHENPWAGLVMDSAGNLYGTATGGGKGYGLVFEITP